MGLQLRRTSLGVLLSIKIGDNPAGHIPFASEKDAVAFIGDLYATAMSHDAKVDLRRTQFSRRSPGSA